MEKIKNLLDRYKKLTIPNEELRNKVVSAVEEVSGIKLNIRDIAIKNKIAYINLAGTAKSEIFMNKNKIIERLKEEIVNIR